MSLPPTIDDLLGPEDWDEAMRQIARLRREVSKKTELHRGLHSLLAFRVMLETDGPTLEGYVARLSLDKRQELRQRVADEIEFLCALLALLKAPPSIQPVPTGRP